MFSFAAAALIVFVARLSTVSASIYVNNPTSTAVCYGGQPCTVTWLDDGQTPLLSEIGACYVGLYNGNRDLIQQIDPVNVASQHSFTFTPDATAGPDSSSYYVNFTLHPREHERRPRIARCKRYRCHRGALEHPQPVIQSYRVDIDDHILVYWVVQQPRCALNIHEHRSDLATVYFAHAEPNVRVIILKRNLRVVRSIIATRTLLRRLRSVCARGDRASLRSLYLARACWAFVLSLGGSTRHTLLCCAPVPFAPSADLRVLTLYALPASHPPPDHHRYRRPQTSAQTFCITSDTSIRSNRTLYSVE
ncbi:hypothetical protein EVJ58_g9164 [Rhodofomes roseus]|uniref:Yeast cell wall synthesis Kre9/Knh1-like N-terminal domain-containing protein n=1 Tax=Rhodofomes roseus TaxID=34475 RepID=A0A4Y9XZ98_9APHY|nr:hypothetical protein EVJ58_g9164 [Rhodofomes roseus]